MAPNGFDFELFSPAAIEFFCHKKADEYADQQLARESNSQAEQNLMVLIGQSLEFSSARQVWLQNMLRKIKCGIDARAASQAADPPLEAAAVAASASSAVPAALAAAMAAVAVPAEAAAPTAAVEIPDCNGLDFFGRQAHGGPPFPVWGSLHLEPKYHTGNDRNDKTYCFLAAAYAGCIGCLSRAIADGIDVNVRSSNAGFTALAWAIHGKKQAAVQLLLQLGGQE